MLTERSMDHLGDRSSSNSPPTQTQQHKRRRQRKTLSCTQCKERKIRCDRNVPSCSSCVVRGIQHTCRWGDERDDDNRMTFEEDHQAVQQVTTSKQDQDHGPDIETIVDVVLDKLKRRGDNTSSPDSTDFPGLKRRKTESTRFPEFERVGLYIPGAPPEHRMGCRIPAKAFSGITHCPIAMLQLNQEDERMGVESDLLRSSLQRLPSRRAFDRLVDGYLLSCEPMLNIFNKSILKTQLERFWQGVAELGLPATQSNNHFWNFQRRSFEQTVSSNFYPNKEGISPRVDSPSAFLSTRTRQGLVALVFALADAGARALPLHELISLSVLPSGSTEDKRREWYEEMHQISNAHLSLSQFMVRPTIWSLQVMLLIQFRNMQTRRQRLTLANMHLAVALAVDLGLNRLGSAYDDIEGCGMKLSEPEEPPKKQSTSYDSTDLLVNSRHGTFIAVFEDGDLALRELGRKVWTTIVSFDYIMASHLNMHHCIHESSNFTSPPAMISDEDILSPHAEAILCHRRDKISLVATENDFSTFFLALSYTQRTLVDLENVKGSPLRYEDILMIDSQFQAIINTLPDHLRLDTNRKIANKYSPRHEIILEIQCLTITDNVYFRLIRLHRQYVSKGLHRLRYRRSLEICMEAAYKILDCYGKLLKLNDCMQWSFIMKAHLFHAALVLQLVLIYEMDRQRQKLKDALSQEAYQLNEFNGALSALRSAIELLQGGESNPFTAGFLPGLTSFVQMAETFQRQRRDGARYSRDYRSDQHLNPQLSSSSFTAPVPSFTPDASYEATASDSASNTGTTPSWPLRPHNTPNSSSSSIPEPQYLTGYAAEPTEPLMGQSNGEDWSLSNFFPDISTQNNPDMDFLQLLELANWSKVEGNQAFNFDVPLNLNEQLPWQ